MAPYIHHVQILFLEQINKLLAKLEQIFIVVAGWIPLKEVSLALQMTLCLLQYVHSECQEMEVHL